MSKSLLLICRQAPWAGMAAREALDMALAGGAFDLPVSLLFLGDGVLQLVSGQQPSCLQQKDLGANLQALPLFGIEALYAAHRDVQQRGLDAQALSMPVTLLENEHLANLLSMHDVVVTL